MPIERVNRVRQKVAACDSLLVIGSSLYVFSGYRFLLQAKELAKKIAIINIGKTRADHLADIKLSAKAGDVLSKVVL